MSGAMSSSLGIAAYLALFAGVGLLFLFANLLIGRLVRPANPHAEKSEIYECGEPAIGTSYGQFDLRFYVVALLFIIFDVEVAFFFPWATVFGKATHLQDERFAVVAADKLLEGELTDEAAGLYRELGVVHPRAPQHVPDTLVESIPKNVAPAERSAAIIRQGARQLVLLTIVDILVFFGVLLVGFAYVWKRGDLNWVRAVAAQDEGSSNAGTVSPHERPAVPA